MTAWRSSELIEGESLWDASRRTGRSLDAVYSAYRRHGISFTHKRRGYPESTRNRALALRQSGMTFQQVARATGVSLRTIKAWAA